MSKSEFTKAKEGRPKWHWNSKLPRFTKKRKKNRSTGVLDSYCLFTDDDFYNDP
jgi:hypothetical protein